MRRTGLTTCAYCGRDFAASYEAWLTMALDHVVPVNVCHANGLPEEWREDVSNRVLACSACNGFRNRYEPPEGSYPTTFDAFYDLRDRIFEERRGLIAQSHESDRRFFEAHPWNKFSPGSQPR